MFGRISAALETAKFRITRRINPEEGQGLVEYALIIGLIAVAAIAVMGLMGGGVTAKFQAIVDELT